MDPTFSIFTALAYFPPPAAISLPLLPEHLERLRTAHSELSTKLPDSWCALVHFPNVETIRKVLLDCVELGGQGDAQRIRLLVGPDGLPNATSTPLVPNPQYPVRLVVDTQSTDYSSPFLFYKTTNRSVYDDARTRNKANLIPSQDDSEPPFDVLLYNDKEEITETSISNCAFCLDPSVSKDFVTPALSCGLLEGVKRAELLKLGEIIGGIVTMTQLKKASNAGTLQTICFNAVRGVYPAHITFPTVYIPRSITPDYSKFSMSGIDLMEAATAPPAHRLILQSIDRSPSSTQPILLLDNACGAGVVTKFLFELSGLEGRTVEVVAGDFEEKMVELMRARVEKNGWNARALVVDAQAIPFPDNHFTHVATNFAIQLLPDPILALKESHRVLQKGGITSFTSWTRLGWLPTIQLANPSFPTPGITTGPWAIPSTIHSTLTTLGFGEIKITPYEFESGTDDLGGYVEGMKALMGTLISGEIARRLMRILEEKRDPEGVVKFAWTALIVSATKL